MTAGITVRPNADRRDSGNEGTLARVGERSGNGGRGRIRVTSPRDRIAVVIDASARHSEIHRSNVALVLVGNTSTKSEVSVELDSRRDYDKNYKVNRTYMNSLAINKSTSSFHTHFDRIAGNP